MDKRKYVYKFLDTLLGTDVYIYTKEGSDVIAFVSTKTKIWILAIEYWQYGKTLKYENHSPELILKDGKKLPKLVMKHLGLELDETTKYIKDWFYDRQGIKSTKEFLKYFSSYNPPQFVYGDLNLSSLYCATAPDGFNIYSVIDNK